MDDNKTTPIQQHDKLKDIDIVSEMKTNYINYAMSVIVARALPDVRDGLKPVQRRILYSMFKLGILSNKPYKKSARTVGDAMAKYHPHGDFSIYEAMVRMAQDFNLRYMLVDGQGNFGSVDGDGAAAMRYTEARISKLGEELIGDLSKETVDFMPNYDGSYFEPEVMPANLPNLILNGADGIAVGMATKIAPHNLVEIADAIDAMIKAGNSWKGINDWKWEANKFEQFKAQQINETYETRTQKEVTEDMVSKPDIFPYFESDLSLADLMQFVKGPDFPTAAAIYNIKDIEETYATGRGRVLMRAKAQIIETKGKFQIVISELPYQVNKARLVAKIAQLVKDKKIEGISDLRDESSRLGIRVVVDLKRDGKPKTILNKLYKYTEMQKAFNSNMVVLVDGEPRLLGLKNILEYYISHRQEVVIRSTYFDLVKAQERAHILEGLMIALANLDEVIRTIRESQTQEIAKENLIKRFKLSEIQAQAILDMQLRRLAALERLKIEQEYAEIKKLIEKLTAILESPQKVLNIISEDLARVKEKFGDERRTKVYKGGVDEFSDEDLVAEEKVVVTISEQGYIKRIKEDAYTLQNRGGKGKTAMTTKEGDHVSHVFVCSTHDEILFFTNIGKVFQLKVYDIPEFGRTAKGQAIINLINIEQGELVTSVLTRSSKGIVGEDVKEEGEERKENYGADYKYLIFATKNGTVKKTVLSEYENIRSNGLIAINLESGDELRWVKPTTGENEMMLVTKFARSIKFNEKDVRPTGRASIGVRGIKFRDKTDEVIGMDIVRTDEDMLLTISSNGYGKTTKLSGFPIQGRGGQGVFAFQMRTKTGHLVTARTIDHPNKDLLIISESGTVIRIPTGKIPLLSRQTSGVKLMDIGKGDSVAAIAFV